MMKLILLLLISSVGYSQKRERDTVEVVMLVVDVMKSTEAFAVNGYSVREIHNEAEGVIDWGMDHFSPPKDYGVHVMYLDDQKKPLSKSIIVWLSKDL